MSNTEALRKAATDALRIFDWLERRSIYGDADMTAVHLNLRAALAKPAASGEPVAIRLDFVKSESRWNGEQVRTTYRMLSDKAGPLTLYATAQPAPARVPQWIPSHERVPAPGTECVVLLRYTLDRPPFASVDKWDIQREDPLGMGGPTIETGEGWNDNFESDVIAWFPVPPHPPAEWDQRLAAAPGAPDAQEPKP